MEYNFISDLPSDVVQIIYKYIHKSKYSECLNEHKLLFPGLFEKYTNRIRMTETCKLCFERNRNRPYWRWLRCSDIIAMESNVSIINGKMYKILRWCDTVPYEGIKETLKLEEIDVNMINEKESLYRNIFSILERLWKN